MKLRPGWGEGGRGEKVRIFFFIDFLGDWGRKKTGVWEGREVREGNYGRRLRVGGEGMDIEMKMNHRFEE
jgi:hypothetical protein